MKKLLIYKEDSQFVIERVNEFNHATKRFFISESGLFEGLKSYNSVIDEYELEISDDLWAKVINFLNSNGMQSPGQPNELLALHKKMYDVRWNGVEGDSEQLEKEFLALAERLGVDLEKVNELLNQLYVAPYKDEMLPEHLKSNYGGKREGSGRPSLGTTRKVSITLPDEVWEMIEKEKENMTMSAYLRFLIGQKFKQ